MPMRITLSLWYGPQPDPPTLSSRFDSYVQVLVGNKCDLEDKRAITLDQGRALAREFGINADTHFYVR
jgi:GTPase SAR1 family protein